MTYTVRDIAQALKANAFGAVDLLLDRVAEPIDAGPNDLALALNPKYADDIISSKARVAMLWDGADWEAMGLEAAIIVPGARFAMAGLTSMFDLGQGYHKGIHPSAVIHPDANLGENVSVGPLSIVEVGAQIGDNSVIGPQCYIGTDATIGQNAFLRDNVSIAARVTIGENFWCQPGARIGGDGFSYATVEKSNAEEARKSLGKSVGTRAQSWERIHSLGAVTIGDNVEVGSNATIDRGTIRDTRIGNGVKIDNLVMVAHNVTVGDNTLLCGLTGIAGSSQIGSNVVLAGQTGVGDNLKIGDNVITGGGTKLLSNVPAGRMMLGNPATKMDIQVESYKSLRRLPKFMKDMAALKKAVSKLSPND
ncbi:MAG: UDP-3-O-(3-hydroxymyristoyl)glucosamine N-acyltransferase [Cognatishimia sp.]